MDNGYFPIDGNLADPPHGGSSASKPVHKIELNDNTCTVFSDNDKDVYINLFLSDELFLEGQSAIKFPAKYSASINLKQMVENYEEVRVNVEDMNNVDSLIFELNGKEYKLDFQRLLEDYGVEVKE